MATLTHPVAIWCQLGCRGSRSHGHPPSRRLTRASSPFVALKVQEDEGKDRWCEVKPASRAGQPSLLPGSVVQSRSQIHVATAAHHRATGSRGHVHWDTQHNNPPWQSLWRTLFQSLLLKSTGQLWVFLVDGGSSGTLSLLSKCGISLSGPGDRVGKDGGDYVDSVLFQILFGFIWGAGSQFCFGEVVISFYFPAICLVSLPTQLQ